MITDKQKNRLVLMMCCFYILMGLSTDLIAPSLPAISHQLSISPTFTKNLVSIILLGIGIGNFVIGFLSDAWGRRHIFLGGTLLFSVVSLIPVFYPNGNVLMGCRFLQGVGLSCAAVTSRAVLADLFDPDMLKLKAPLLATAWGIGPIIGPFIGGYLQHYFGWQSCFIFLSVYGLIGLTVMYFVLIETIHTKTKLSLTKIKRDFKMIASNKTFIGLVLFMGISYGLILYFSTLGPFYIQVELKQSAIAFGHTALVMGISFLVGTLVTRKLLKRHSFRGVLSYSLLASFMILITALMFSYFNALNYWAVVIPAFCMYFLVGIMYPTCLGKGISMYPQVAGSASAVMNLINMSAATASVFVFSLVTASTSFIMNGVVFMTLLFAAVIYFTMFRRTV